jgi:peptidoglycan/LPS O-acetylase OafA/YrhL
MILLDLMANYFVFFVLGIGFSFYVKSVEYINLRWLLMALFCFIAGQIVFHYGLGLHYTDKGIASLLLAVVSIGVVVITSIHLSSKANQVIIYIGSSSMAIYLMHILVTGGVRIFLSTFLAIDSFSIHLFIGCFAGLLIPLLCLAFINKYKIPYLFSAPVSHYLMPRDKK